MHGQSNRNSFIFNNEIDSDFLFSLYENDFQYVQEIFGITLSQLNPDLLQIQQAYEAADLARLKQAVHKLKPSFGFVGLTGMQDQCAVFEAQCMTVASITDIEEDFRRLWQSLVKSRELIETEFKKLKSHNAAV